MERIISCFFAFILLSAFIPPPLFADPTSDAILRLLVKKGLISQQEVDAIKVEVQSGAVEVPAGIDQRVTRLEENLSKVPSSKKDTLEWYWKNGLRFETKDEKFKFKLGGRVSNDWAVMPWEDEDIKKKRGALEDAAEIRHARIHLSGLIYDRIEFKTQYDFVGGDPEFKDVYVGYLDIPYAGNFRAGQFKEPFSLDELTSSKYSTFMEPALPNDLVPSRNIGLMLSNAVFDERMTWAAGVFRDATDFGEPDTGDEGGRYSLTSRIAGLPWHASEKELLHVGFGYSHRAPLNNETRFRARPEAHLAPRLMDTGTIVTEAIDLFGPEAALVYGPFSLQSEFIDAVIESRPGDNPNFMGYYVFASYFLTGEHREYDPESGEFDRVKPLENFRGPSGGWGAWELAARYSRLDLSDGNINGGDLQDITIGVNWYLNPNFRWMFNYVLGDLRHGGEANIFQMRFQLDV